MLILALAALLAAGAPSDSGGVPEPARGASADSSAPAATRGGAAMLRAAAPIDTATHVPGTHLRFGLPLRSALARGTFGQGKGAAGAWTGPIRFYGVDAQATLTFERDRLTRVRIQAKDPSPAGTAYIEDALTREGFRRECQTYEPEAHVCDWSGRGARAHLELRPGSMVALLTALPKLLPRPAAVAMNPVAVPVNSDTAIRIDRRAELAGAETAPGHAATATPFRPNSPAGDPGLEILDPPRAIEKPRPSLPEAAIRAGVFGRVTVQAMVDTAGVVRDVRIQKGIAELNAAALACARRYRFESPRRSDGRKTSLWVPIPIVFTLADSAHAPGRP